MNISSHITDVRIAVKVFVFNWSRPNKTAKNPPAPMLKNREALVKDKECCKSSKFFSKEFILTQCFNYKKYSQ